jgi:hypothetical protein
VVDGTTLVTRQPGMIEAEAAGELVGLHVDRGVCYGFNETATRVWQLLEQPRTVDELTAALMAEHEVDEAECREGLAEMLGMLENEQLVSLAPR